MGWRGGICGVKDCGLGECDFSFVDSRARDEIRAYGIGYRMSLC